MIPFDYIYKKAVTLFDDPKITNAYETNKIAFCKYMYAFLNSVSIYEPVIIGQLLSDVISPKGELELIDSDGVSTTYDLTIEIPPESYINFTGAGQNISAIIDSEAHTVTFDRVIDAGEEYGVEYYQPGYYKADFSCIASDDIFLNDVSQKVTNILARLIVIAWAESTRDMLVDIQGILRDTDFKLTPNSQILSAKTKWVKELQSKNQKEQTQLAWRVRYSHGRAKWTRF